MGYTINFLGINDIKYTEDGKELHLFTDFRDGLIELSLKDIKNWNSPYNNDEITIEEKQRILKNIYNEFLVRGWEKIKKLKFDFSPESNINGK